MTLTKNIYPLKDILNLSGCNVKTDDTGICANKGKHEKQIIVYPAMLVEPREKIYVSGAYRKYVKPYAVQKILDEI